MSITAKRCFSIFLPFWEGAFILISLVLKKKKRKQEKKRKNEKKRNKKGVNRNKKRGDGSKTDFVMRKCYKKSCSDCGQKEKEEETKKEKQKPPPFRRLTCSKNIWSTKKDSNKFACFIFDLSLSCLTFFTSSLFLLSSTSHLSLFSQLSHLSRLGSLVTLTSLVESSLVRDVCVCVCHVLVCVLCVVVWLCVSLWLHLCRAMLVGVVCVGGWRERGRGHRTSPLALPFALALTFSFPWLERPFLPCDLPFP